MKDHLVKIKDRCSIFDFPNDNFPCLFQPEVEISAPERVIEVVSQIVKLFFDRQTSAIKNGQELNPALSSLHWCILGFLSFLFIQRSMFLPTLYPHYYCLVLRHSCSKTIHFFKSKLLCLLLTFSFVPNTLFLRL